MMIQKVPSPRRLAGPLPLLLLSALPLLVGGCDSAEAERSEQGLVILNPSTNRDYFHDFGNIPFGEKVTHTFLLQNTDSKPVTVQDLQSSCSCSVGRISYVDAEGRTVVGNRRAEPVIVLPPGVTSEITFEVDTSHVRVKNVDKLAQVRLRCDSLNTPFITFEMHLLVELAFQATPWTIDLGAVPISTGSRGISQLITGVPGGLSRVIEVQDRTEGLEVGLVEEVRAQETLWTVEAILSPPLELGPWQGMIVLATTGADGTGTGRPFEIPVHARVVEDVVFRPPTLAFTRFSSIDGTTATGEVVALAPGHRTKIVGGRLEGELPAGLGLEFEPIDPDGAGRSARWTVRISAPPSIELKRFVGRVVMDLDDPAQEKVEAGFIFRPA